MNIEDLGFNNWFQEKVDSAKLADYEIARVIVAEKDKYIVKNGLSEVFAEITGKLMYDADSALDFPAVGDWVYVQYVNDDSFAIIHEVFPRKSVLKRKTSGTKIDFQLIAANIDIAFIIQSLDHNYSLNRLERYLVMVRESNIRPIILLSKRDLLSPIELEKKELEISEALPQISVVTFSNIDNAGLERIKDLLEEKYTFCLLGSSGVGKTTLLNNLLGDTVFETRAVREKDSRGRHTTTRRQLIVLKNGSMIIDTPGMREMGSIGTEMGLNDVFEKIIELSGQCRYNDCSHTQEAGCAIQDAIKKGIISNERYHNYEKMKKESVFNEMSYLEKRRKDKEFGKMIKAHKKASRTHLSLKN